MFSGQTARAVLQISDIRPSDSADRTIQCKATKNEVLGELEVEDTLNSFGVSPRVINISRGSSVTR